MYDYSDQTTSGLTVRAIYRDLATGNVYTGSGFEAWQDGHYTTYAIACTEDGTSGTYKVQTPALVAALAQYRVTFLKYTGTLATDVANKIGVAWGPMLPAVNSNGSVPADLGVMDGGIPSSRWLPALVAFETGKSTVTDHGDGTYTIVFFGTDGTTPRLTITAYKTDGHRTTATIA